MTLASSLASGIHLICVFPVALSTSKVRPWLLLDPAGSEAGAADGVPGNVPNKIVEIAKENNVRTDE